MGTSNKLGFTIIETMLFLAITGLMVVGILVGTGATINVQRYRDGVVTLKSYLQEQYSDVINVRNSTRTTPISCDDNANITNSGVTDPRGQSDCKILGRYVTIVDTSSETSVVVGYGSSSAASNDISDLKKYKLSLLPSSTEKTDLEWGTKIAWPAKGPGSKSPTTPRSISILILRSPVSGLIYTFTADDNKISLSNMIVAGDTVPGQGQQKICVDPAGLLSGGGDLSVFINAYATGPSSIETRSNNMGDLSSC